MAEVYICDYVEPGSQVECGDIMEDVPSETAPGEYVRCKSDGNTKQIISIPADWRDISNKPEDFENAIYTILGWKLDSSKYGELRSVDSINRIRQYLNDVILKNCQTDFQLDKWATITLLNRYYESLYGEDALVRKENKTTTEQFTSANRIQFTDESTYESLFEVDDDQTIDDLYWQMA